MTSIRPQIAKLNDVSTTHSIYAKTLLQLILNKLVEMEEIDIGVINENKGSIIAFDSDDFEHVLLELRYKRYKFSLKVTDNTEDYRSSVFLYTITEDSELYSMIPEGLIELMEEVATDFEPRVYGSKSLKR